MLGRQILPRFAVAALLCGCAQNPAVGIPPPAPAGAWDGSEAALGEVEGTGSSDLGKDSAHPAWMRQASSKLTTLAKGRTRAWDLLAEMGDRFGHRLSGSRALEGAIDWTLDQMRADGLTEVRREKVMVPHWVRGKESAQVIAPAKHPLRMLGLGGSVGTRGPLRAEVAVVDHIDAIEKTKGLAGKIVLINQVMPPYDHAERTSGYGHAVAARTSGAVEAAKQGARAVLIRSVTAHSLDTPHTGAMRYQDGVKKIPAAALTQAGAEELARMAARGPVKVELRMGARTLPDAVSGNAIGELRGRELPDEVVVIGGHIDSWDVGQGAHDDGSGCIMAVEAAAMLKELGLMPRRTIRVVLFTNEENGLRGAKAYFEAHGKEKHVAAIEADAGSGEPKGFGVKTDDKDALELVESYSSLFKGLGTDNIGAGWGGADISPLTEIGVLSVSVRPDGSHYFDYHHSPADTVDKVVPDYLQRNAASMALLAYILAERE